MFTHSLESGHFSKNREYEYRICAKNGVGMGACSEALSVLTDTVPYKMNPPDIADIFHDQTILTWRIITDDEKSGRSPVVKYLL